jgi:hypothetical protein
MTQALVSWLRQVATGTDSAAAASPAQLQVPQVSAGSVIAVADNRICENAAGGYNVAIGLPSSTVRSAYVVKVGTVFVVRDPTVKVREWAVGVTLDKRYRCLAKLLG